MSTLLDHIRDSGFSHHATISLKAGDCDEAFTEFYVLDDNGNILIVPGAGGDPQIVAGELADVVADFAADFDCDAGDLDIEITGGAK